MKLLIRQAIEKAVGFLLVSRTGDGWWQDFYLRAGWSDEWVTGYTGSALASIPEYQSEARAAWELLLTRRTDGWGYNGITPCDADSTCWALQLAQTLQIREPRVEHAEAFLRQHLRPSGGITTYAVEPPIRQFIREPWYKSMSGWCGNEHLCVTAAAANLANFRGALIQKLSESQTPKGNWIGYWWCDSEYATALSAQVLATEGDWETVQRAVEWGKKRFQAGENLHPFPLAWLIQTLLLNPNLAQSEINNALQCLLWQQQSNGSWKASAWLRLPLPEEKNPENYENWTTSTGYQGSVNLDHKQVFTTVTALKALYHAWQAL